MTRVVADSPFAHGEGPEILLLSRNPDRALLRAPWLKKPCFSFIKGEITSIPRIDGRFKYLLHGGFDANVPLGVQGADSVRRLVLDGTRNLLSISRQIGVTGCLYVSSGAVYGPPSTTGPIEESRPFTELRDTPTGSYGRAKRESEEHCIRLADEEGFSLSIARCFTFAGAGLPLDAHYAVGNFVRDAAAGGPIRIFGTGRPIRSYLHPGDAACWMWAMAVRQGRPRAFNVGSPEPVSITALAHEVADLAGGLPVQSMAESHSGGAADCYYPDVSRATVELGLKVTVSRRQALSEMLDWARGPREGCR